MFYSYNFRSFCLLAIFHTLVYALLVGESPAQAFLVREQTNLTGLASIVVEAQQQLIVSAAIAGAAILYTTLAYTQRSLEAEAQQSARDSLLASRTQPPSLSSLAGSVSGTHYLGVFAFLPSGLNTEEGAEAATSLLTVCA